MSGLANVSNRVPVKANSSTGGLSTGIMSAMRSSGELWFGWTEEAAPGKPEQEEITIQGGIAYTTVPLPQHLHDRHYSGFANGTLGFRYENQEYAACRKGDL